MRRRLPLILAVGVALIAAVVLAACGGVPGNAVAEVDGNPIEKTSFDHWMTVAAKSSGSSTAQVPQPPDFEACIAAKRKALPKPAKGKPKTTDAQLKQQCKQEYEALRDQVLQLLIQFEWYQGQADKMGIKVTDAEVQKSFQQQKKANFPKEAQYQKFLRDTGRTQADILLQVKLQLLLNKIREQVVKGKDKVSDAQVQAYYDKNKQRFATPERRDLRIVLTKSKAKAQQARRALESGQSFAVVAKRFSIDDASKAQGGKLPAVTKGTQEKAFDDAIFAARKGKLVGPIKTQFGYYVFEVTKITKADQQSLREATPQIKQLLAAEGQNKALESFAKQFNKDWKDKTECREGFVTQACKGAKATPTPTASAAATQPPQ